MPVVYVVHCVDAEGPLMEDIQGTFDRLKKIYGISMDPNEESLKKIQDGDVDFGAHTDAIMKMCSPGLLKYNKSFVEIDNMLDNVCSDSFRKGYRDTYGGGWRYNWFCLDHVGYSENPRCRILGHHKIYDYYHRRAMDSHFRDSVYFHYHPLPFNRKAHACATLFDYDGHLLEILSRKIIDRNYFPSVFRPGFHAERPDSNLFLEQWIPFDYGNQSKDEIIYQPDLADGRYGDWRRAPKIWGGYHPSFVDYQAQGLCRRWIFRCLNMNSRLRQIDIDDVRDAFSQADLKGSSVLAFTNHDFRDMASEVGRLYDMISAVSSDYRHIGFKYSSALEAARAYLGIYQVPELGLKCSIERHGDSVLISVSVDQEIFNPQPFLAIKTLEGLYYHDNFDLGPRSNSWRYVFDWQTFLWDQIEAVGIAAVGFEGQVEILNISGSYGMSDIYKLFY